MKKSFLLSFVLLLAFCLRGFFLDKAPVSLYWDEVSIGYNAYSLLETGKDEWGRGWPLFFEAFGEFKFPVPIYLVALVVGLMGLSDISVRLGSVILGMFGVGIIYFLAREIFKSQKTAVLAAFILAISPWHLQFSRAMFESNLAVTFLMMAILAAIKFGKSKKIAWLALFLASAAAAIYSYATMILVLPLLVLLTIIVFYQGHIKQKLFPGIGMLCLIGIILIPFYLHVQTNSYVRFSQVSIFSQNEILEKVINLRVKYGGISAVVFNQYSAAIINLFANFVRYIDPRFLWPGQDGNPRHGNGFGLVYPIEFIFFLAGVIQLFLTRRKIFWYLAISIWLFFAAASLTKDSPHALRSEGAVVWLAIVFSCGVIFLARRKMVKFLVVASYLVLMIIYLTKYYDFSREQFFAWGMENKMMMIKARDIPKDKTIYFTGDYWRSYIYYYYYLKVPPAMVQQNNNSAHLDNVYFGYAKWDKADRRYDFSFRPESLFEKENLVMFLSPEEKEAFKDELPMNNLRLKEDIYYNDKYIFSIYEK